MSIYKFVKKIIPKSIKQKILSKIENKYNHEVTYTIKECDKQKLCEKAIMVTGATGAIGTAICNKLLLQGAIVGVCGRNQEKISLVVERLKAHIKQLGLSENNIIPIVMDVTDDKNVEQAIDIFVSKTGKLDAFINNAGGSARIANKPIYEQEISIIDDVLDLNLRGSIICARKAAQIMIPQKAGKIINMSSVVGMQGKENMSDYAAAKAGIIGFTKSFALEMGKHNINVNAISPGMVNQIPFDSDIKERYTNGNCLKRFGHTEEVASLVSYLVGDEGNYITGQNICVDGGRTLGLMGD